MTKGVTQTTAAAMRLLAPVEGVLRRRRADLKLLRAAKALAQSDLAGYSNVYAAFAKDYAYVLDSLAAAGFARDWLEAVILPNCDPLEPLSDATAPNLPEVALAFKHVEDRFRDAGVQVSGSMADADGQIINSLYLLTSQFPAFANAVMPPEADAGHTALMTAVYDVYMDERTVLLNRRINPLSRIPIPPEIAVRGGSAFAGLAIHLVADLMAGKRSRTKVRRMAEAIRRAEGWR